MSLQRRLLLSLLICAPVVWAIALAVSVHRARHEVNELFDSELIRLARHVQATVIGARVPGQTPQRAPARGDADPTMPARSLTAQSMPATADAMTTPRP